MLSLLSLLPRVNPLPKNENEDEDFPPEGAWKFCA